MNAALLGAVVLVLAAAPKKKDAEAPEAPTCAVDAKLFRPQFPAKLPRGFKLASTKKEKRGITQTLKHPEGFEIIATVSGCEHLSYSIGIKGKTITTKTVASELVAVARRVLPTVPSEKDATIDPKGMLKALEDAQINVMPAQLPCGDATCQLSLEAAPDPKAAKAKAKPAPKKTKGADEKPAEEEKKEDAGEQPGVLRLSYDFAM